MFSKQSLLKCCFEFELQNDLVPLMGVKSLVDGNDFSCLLQPIFLLSLLDKLENQKSEYTLMMGICSSKRGGGGG